MAALLARLSLPRRWQELLARALCLFIISKIKGSRITASSPHDSPSPSLRCFGMLLSDACVLWRDGGVVSQQVSRSRERALTARRSTPFAVMADTDTDQRQGMATPTQLQRWQWQFPSVVCPPRASAGVDRAMEFELLLSTALTLFACLSTPIWFARTVWHVASPLLYMQSSLH